MDVVQIPEDEVMSKEEFAKVGFNDKLRVGGRCKLRGEVVLAREKVGNYVRVMDKRCGSRLHHHNFLTLVESFDEEVI